MNSFRIYFESILNILGVDHPQDEGVLEKKGCKVRFIIFKPLDLEAYPYILWISKGTHLHPPPPSTKIPAQFCKEILSVLSRINDPTLTTSKYILNLFRIHSKSTYRWSFKARCFTSVL
jgi:hypothetical protein